MQSLRQNATALRRLPGGTALTIVERWPLPLVIRTLGDITLTALGRSAEQARNTEEEDHDGWQPVRMRHEPLHSAPIAATPARVRLG